MSGTTEDDIVVVGAGVIGCAAARELAADHDVRVIEKGQVAAEASALAAGEVTMLTTYTDEGERAVARHAIDFFESYDGTGDFHFERRPSLELVTAEREEEARARTERLRGEGHPVEWLDVDEVDAEYDRFQTDSIVGGVRWEGTGFVDPYTFSVTLKRDAEERGAVFETETAVGEFLVEDGAVSGVVTDEGERLADNVVVAAGWRTEELLRDVYQVPVQPYRTQCIVLEPDDPLSDRFPMGWIPGQHVYFRGELNGDLLVGGWSFAEDDPESASGQEDESFREHVASLLPRFFTEFDGAGVVNGWAGVDGATPDTFPIIDAPADAPDGLVVATGFNGRGIMTAPVAATLVGDFVRDDDPRLPTDPFEVERFDSRSPDFRFISISAGDEGELDDESEEATAD
jgi:glycine/D-amino acid oxidase-like deaminating enzyme